MSLKKLVFIAFLTLALGAQAQKRVIPDDPGVGLVLSGGGAKCLAQVGALQVIDSLGISLDYISGTSMGAIVGSMYAMGYSVKDIEMYLRNTDWEALLTNEVPRNRLGYFDRKAESRYLLTFPIEDGKVHLPSAFNYSQYILKQLSYLTQQSYHYRSFSDFPTPFLCVATDLEKGELRVFEDGRLIDALRASSAFPSLFTPYELNGKLYVDGGVINNFPVKPLLSKGMNYIIGIDVQDVLYEKEELNSLVRILEQTSSFIRAESNEEQLAYTDLLIKPELNGAGITSFDQFDKILESGRRAARKKIPELLKLRQKTSYPNYRSKYPAKPLEEFYIDSIVLTGNKLTTDEFVLSKLRLHPLEWCSAEKLDKGLDHLYGSKYFETIDYSLQPSDTGHVLHINLRENPSLSQFRLGLHYDDDFKTALLLNYTQRNLLFKNSRLSLDLAVGDNPRLQFNYFVDRGFVPTMGVKFRANRFETRLYQNLKPLTEITYSDFSLDFFLQSTIYDAMAVGGGIQLEGVDVSEQLEVIGYTDTYRNYINYYAFLDFDSFNHANYPTQGSKFSLGGKIISRQEKLEKFYNPSSVLDLSLSQAFHLSDRFSAVAQIFGAATVGPSLDDDLAYNVYLGSLGNNYINYIYPFIGYRFMELVGRNAAVVRTDLYYQIIKKHYLVLRGNVGQLQPTFDELFDSDVVLDGYSIGYSFDSPLGPLELNVMGSTNHSNIYTHLSLGFWF